ncbi:MAG TPA: nickel-binding protein [Puia sp.]|nr:nickel-binding protein [Puia sp.]
MPIYMDRHDVGQKVTADDVAKLHQEDLRVEHLFGCKGMTYWFDEKRNTAFCLIEAPDMAAVHAMHKHAHGEVPNRVIEVSTVLVESFLGRIEDPEHTGAGPLNIIDESAFRIVMMVVLKRFSPASAESEEIRGLVGQFHEDVQRIAGSSGGRKVRHSENRQVVSFTNVAAAVHVAREIQARYNNVKTRLAPATLKIGLSAGEPVTDKKHIFEDAIRLADRMCRIVKGDIILSAEVGDLYDSEKPGRLKKEKTTHCLTPLEERFLTDLMDFTESAWRDLNVRVDDFGKPIGCSKSQLYRKLMSLTGKSPNSFLREYRLHEALTLLNKQSKNISEVAFETGFNSPSYFSKCFQKQYGRLPSDYLSELAG